MKVKSVSRVLLLATPWTAAYQAPPSMGFSRQEYWSGVPLPSDALTHLYLCSSCSGLSVSWTPPLRTQIWVQNLTAPGHRPPSSDLLPTPLQDRLFLPLEKTTPFPRLFHTCTLSLLKHPLTSPFWWVCAQSLSPVQFFATLWAVADRLLCPWDSPGKNTGMDSHSLLQGIFPTQGSNPPTLASPALAGRDFTNSPAWDAHFGGWNAPNFSLS